MNKKQPGDPSATPDQADEPGRLRIDDRGSATGQWDSAVDLFADDEPDNAGRVQALVDLAMQVQDETDGPLHGLALGAPKGLTAGYDPYDRGEPGQQDHGNKKKKNLQELSKWIALRKKIAERTDD